MPDSPSLNRAQMKQVIEEGGSVLMHTGDGPKLIGSIDRLPPDVDVLNPSDPVAVRAALQDADTRIAAAHSERERLIAMQAAAAAKQAADAERERLLAEQGAAPVPAHAPASPSSPGLPGSAIAPDQSARETMPWEGAPRKRRNKGRRAPKSKGAARAAKQDEPPKE
jgi:hypothetical protein